MSKTRLEAFSDGVMAIIITIMVLELKIPQGTNWNTIEPLLPTLGSYVLSFVFIGIYWGNHHHLLHTLERVNGKIIWANLHLLFWLSLVPVATGWMGENGFDSVTVAMYGMLLVCCGVAFNLLGNIISNGHKPEHPFVKVYQQTKIKGVWSSLLYLASIPLAFVHPGISCGLFALVAILWIVPNKEVEKLLNADESAGASHP
ncbi:MAG TPA: TMEM175 family protein [Candidatus Kapabacteria bacterium]|nr:TMEM175 family protein [Candidatus Kapabacteria bacterium]